ncbi:MAG: DsbA family protein [Sneathiellaceae bacterium]
MIAQPRIALPGPASRRGAPKPRLAGRMAGLGLAASLALAAGTALVPTPASAEMSAAEKAEMGQFVREYLMANPEVLVEALDVLQQRDQAAKQDQAKAAIAMHQDKFKAGPTTFAAGPEDASTTMVEFFDYRCGYCRRALPTIQEMLAEDDDLRVVFVEFPILGEESVIASRAAMASLKQDRSKYMDFHNALMTTRGNLSEQSVMGIAGSLGLDVGKLKADMASPEIEAALASNHAMAQAIGVNGTPAFIVGDTLVPGAVPKGQLQDLVAESRKGG